MNRNVIATLVALALLTSVGVAIWASQPDPTLVPKAEPKTAAPKKADSKPVSRTDGLKMKIRERGSKNLQSRGPEDLMPPPTGPIPEGPDLIFVTWDTVRADHCSTYGFSRKTTEGLSALGAEGLIFDDFIVPQATTLPSHVSMFTGTHPEEHGVIGNAMGAGAFVPPAELPTLAGHLSDHGYRTAAFVSSTPVKKFSGLHAGFQVWSEPVNRDRISQYTVGGTLLWLKNQPTDRPLFLWVHLYDPHHPYRNPKGTEELFTEDLGAWIGDRQIQGIVEGAGPDEIEARIRAYDREIYTVDKQTTRLLQGLAARGRDQVVVVAGDHGEGLGQHAHMEHGLLWQEQLRAPLVITAPGVTPQRVSTLTAAKDIVPTIMGLAEFPAEAEMLAETSGRNVLVAPKDVPILSRTSIRQTRTDLPMAGGYPTSWALTSTDHTFVVTENGTTTLYDRKADPLQQKNIAADHPDLVAAFAAEVDARRKRHAIRHNRFGAGQTVPLDDDVIQQLKALGYLEP